ncbi:hypothetical protein TrLO_g4468 [Triparma laevis f. longispina]|uniref:Uncharacterized protein n=1 Tax=Triparma laevis f. longispina TaxID=1714387 RepID=A0A9W7L0H2_9STRA|nr:hypothetical protein TrLO_g4468 [Triparma laevis f. longispina]
MEEVAAFFWDFDSRANMEISGDILRSFEEDKEGAGSFKKIVKRRQQISSSHGGHHRIVRLRARWHSNELTTTQ